MLGREYENIAWSDYTQSCWELVQQCFEGIPQNHIIKYDGTEKVIQEGSKQTSHFVALPKSLIGVIFDGRFGKEMLPPYVSNR